MNFFWFLGFVLDLGLLQSWNIRAKTLSSNIFMISVLLIWCCRVRFASFELLG